MVVWWKGIRVPAVPAPLSVLGAASVYKAGLLGMPGVMGTGVTVS